MVREISCTNCNALIKVEGPVQGTRETEVQVTCPACKTPNEAMWPIQHGAYGVTLVREGNRPEDILI